MSGVRSAGGHSPRSVRVRVLWITQVERGQSFGRDGTTDSSVFAPSSCCSDSRAYRSPWTVRYSFDSLQFCLLKCRRHHPKPHRVSSAGFGGETCRTTRLSFGLSRRSYVSLLLLVANDLDGKVPGKF